MSVHQVIYTSCMRGINGVNDGQQIYSYDETFTEANSDEVKSLFTYQMPALEPGVIMSEELVPTLPRAFIYRRFDNGSCALSQSTYLGRDYMGSAGRFGNFLSHVVVADEADMTHYPCEFFESGLLRDHMEYEEVNNPNKPDFLPVPALERGYTVDVDSVVAFLGEGDRMTIYRHMLQAVLLFEKEHKRVVICDEPQNIVMWIAALHYAFPLKTALNINFSTYDYNPSLSVSQICGVIPSGTQYTPDNDHYHFVFDMFRQVMPTFELDEDFFEFVDTAMTFSYDSMQAFHRFLEDGYDYTAADEEMVAAYHLYTLLSDGVSGLDRKKILAALTFAQTYATAQERERIAAVLTADVQALMMTDLDVFLSVLRFALEQNGAVDASVKQVSIAKMLYEFVNTEAQEDTFLQCYRQVDEIARQSDLSLAAELLSDRYRDAAYAAVKSGSCQWKIRFLCGLLKSVAASQSVVPADLMFEAPLGQKLFGLIDAAYKGGAANGAFAVAGVLDIFASDVTLLVNMAMNVEGLLLDLPDGERECDAMWHGFEQTMLSSHAQDFPKVYNVLRTEKRYDQLYRLYALLQSNTHDTDRRKGQFNDHYTRFVKADADYAAAFGDRVLEEYFRELSKDSSAKAEEAALELFEMLAREKTDVTFAGALIKSIADKIPYEAPTSRYARWIQDAFEYQFNVLHQPLSGKILLLVIATVMGKCTGKSEMAMTLEKLAVLTSKGKGNLAALSERHAAAYCAWIMPNICTLCQTSADIEKAASLFETDINAVRVFCSTYVTTYLKQNKNEKDFTQFCEFLRFAFDYNDEATDKEIGQLLSKLNKNRLAELSQAVETAFANDRECLRHWETVRGEAESSGDFFGKIAGFFKRKKGD